MYTIQVQEKLEIKGSKVTYTYTYTCKYISRNLIPTSVYIPMTELEITVNAH